MEGGSPRRWSWRGSGGGVGGGAIGDGRAPGTGVRRGRRQEMRAVAGQTADERHEVVARYCVLNCDCWGCGNKKEVNFQLEMQIVFMNNS